MKSWMSYAYRAIWHILADRIDLLQLPVVASRDDMLLSSTSTYQNIKEKRCPFMKVGSLLI